MILSPAISRLAAWADAQAAREPYQEIAIKIIVCGGKIVRTERTATIKELEAADHEKR